MLTIDTVKGLIEMSLGCFFSQTFSLFNFLLLIGPLFIITGFKIIILTTDLARVYLNMFKACLAMLSYALKWEIMA
jgi:hypothetical protein